MLVAAAAGGIGVGWIADRFGRTRAMMLSVALYSIFTAACGFATSFASFLMCRTLLGLGMGGEWTSGAALVSEWWPTEHRGKALGLMQSGWAIGYALAALVSAIVLPRFGWRAVFFIGILPAFLTLWIQRRVSEPEIWIGRGAIVAERASRPVAVRQRHGPRHNRAHADEHVHALRVVGFQSVASELSEGTAGAGRNRAGRRRPRPSSSS